MSDVITAEGVTRRYGRTFVAVDNVDLKITRGTIFGLLGTNGAGKTSTLEMLEGLAPATAGRVRVLGHDPFRQRGKIAQSIGVMLQSGGFPQDLRVAETARMWAGTLARPRAVEEVLGLVGLADRAQRSMKSLSGGERRRLDLALTIMNRPEVVFLDEPTTGLDPESRASAWQLIAGLRDEGATIVLTTHYLDEAESLSDELVIMHRGRVVRAGTADAIVEGHRSTISFAAASLRPEQRRTGPGGPDVRGPMKQRKDRLEIETDDLQGDLYRLLGWACSNDVTLAGLEARAASLEQVFLEIAGNDGIGGAA